MKLNRCNHFSQSGKSGNARAVLCEAFSERHSSDFDKSKTCNNIYFGTYDSGNELADFYEHMADVYKVIDKNGRKKKLRSDAGIGFAGIVKPDLDSMSNMSEDKQIAFLRDSLDCIKEIYEKRGMKICAAVIHTDESNLHLHYTGYDPEYRLGRKLNLRFYRALNVEEYPKMMQRKGWDVEPLIGYLEVTRSMSDDEIAEYKAKRRKERQSGKTAKAYKTEKDAKRRADEIIEQAKREADRIFSAREQALNEREAALLAREKALNAPRNS
jgi:hypothetical protein